MGVKMYNNNEYFVKSLKFRTVINFFEKSGDISTIYQVQKDKRSPNYILLHWPNNYLEKKDAHKTKQNN